MILQVDTIHDSISLQFSDIQKSADSTWSLKSQDIVYKSANYVVKLHNTDHHGP